MPITVDQYNLLLAQAELLTRARNVENYSNLIDYLTGPRFGQLSFNFNLIVNDKELVALMETYVGQNKMYNSVLKQAEAEFLPQVIPVLGEIFIDAADQQERGAFPDEFLDGILKAIYRLPPPKVVGSKPQLAYVELPDLYSYLGSSDDFAAAFHHGALLRNVSNRKKQLRANVREKTIPDSALYEPNKSKRYLYWKALYYEKPFFTVQNKSGKIIQVPIEGSFDETIDARIEAWKRVKPLGAPQWLLFEYGQPKYAPTIKIDPTTVTTKIKSQGRLEQLAAGAVLTSPEAEFSVPGNITGKWVRSLSQLWTETVTSAWNAQIFAFNRAYTPAPAGNIVSQAIEPNYSQSVEGGIRITSPRYGVSYYSYSDYLDRRLGTFFRLSNDKLVRISDLEIFNT